MLQDIDGIALQEPKTQLAWEKHLPMNKSDLNRNAYLLQGAMARKGYMRWWHSFTGVQPETGETRTFFVEYFIINPGLGSEQPILGQHPYFKKRDMRPSYVMIKAGAFPGKAADNQELVGKQLHAFFPISSLKIAKDPLIIQAEDCFYSENHISGRVDVTTKEARHLSLMTDEGSMEWDLEVHKAVACHTGFLSNAFFTALNALTSFWHAEGIRTFYKGSVTLDGISYQVTPENSYGYADKHWGKTALNALTSFWHAEGIRTFYKGSVTLDGISYQVTPENSYGYADKHWGKSYNRPWLQLASCHLISERTGHELKHSALAMDGCSPKFLCFPLKRRLMLQLTYTGEDFEFHFAKPGSFCRCKWNIKETNKRYIWHIMAQNKSAVIKISGSCRKEEMLPLRYEAPDGSKAEVPLSGGGSGYGSLQIYRRTPAGKQLLDSLTYENALFFYQA